MNQLVRPEYRTAGYVYAASAAELAEKYGFEKIARLASNENPYPPSQAVQKAAADAISGVNRYPDPKASGFSEALRKYIYDAPVVTSGLGMDGVIETTIRTLVAPGDKIVISTPTFSVYGIAGKAASARVVNVARRKDFSVDIGEFIAEAKDAKLSFLCSPNNPTGNVTPVSDVEEILKNISGVLFLDCAYAEFAGVEYYDLLKYDNLIIGHTLSKVYGLAGLRIGYAFVPEWFPAPYAAAQTPFTLTEVSSAAACAAVADTKYRADFIAHVKKWRGIFEKEIPYPVVPSGANFILMNVAPEKSDAAVKSLAQQGVLVRSCASFPGLGDTYIRVSIGADWENERFLAAVKNL